MLNSDKFTAYLWSGLGAEAANTATFHENNLVTPNRTLSPFQQFFGKGKKNVLASMQKFGESTIFWEGKEKCPSFDAKIWWNVYRHLQGQSSLG